MFFQFLLLIMVIIIIYKVYIKNIELFDSKQDDLTKENCGRVCTKSPTCKAFAFDSNTNKCYLSKNYILGPPNFGPYLREYDSNQMRCNKLRPIEGDHGVLGVTPEIILRDNTLYLCANKEDADYKYYQIVNGNMDEIDKKDVDKIESEIYELQDIDWTDKDKDYIKREILKPIDQEKNSLEKYKLFEKDSHEYLGQYMFPYKCVSNVSEGECLRFCQSKQDCVGVEWNPQYLESDNNKINIINGVCCPKRNIREIIERRKDFKNGYFYKKNNVDNLEKKPIYLTIDNLEFK